MKPRFFWPWASEQRLRADSQSIYVGNRDRFYWRPGGETNTSGQAFHAQISGFTENLSLQSPKNRVTCPDFLHGSCSAWNLCLPLTQPISPSPSAHPAPAERGQADPSFQRSGLRQRVRISSSDIAGALRSQPRSIHVPVFFLTLPLPLSLSQ